MTRRIVNGLVLVMLLIAAGFVIHTTPSDAQRDAPITVGGEIGDRLTGRNIAVRVNEVSLAQSVSTETWAGETEGVWLVVDASAEAVESENGALLVADLRIGDTVYSASSRPDLDTIAGQSLSVGIPITGPLMFEIPAGSSGAATLQFAQNGDPRADSLLEVHIELPGEVESSITTDEPTTGGAL